MSKSVILADRQRATIDIAEHHVVKGLDIGVRFQDCLRGGLVGGPHSRAGGKQGHDPALLPASQYLTLGNCIKQ